MTEPLFTSSDRSLVAALEKKNTSAFDLLPHHDMREKLVELMLTGIPSNLTAEMTTLFGELRQKLREARVDTVKVVVFGGGSGLSNIIGGDSRPGNWTERPFEGLKRFFPETRAVVCTTDDGGSTGEVLKDVPVFGLGDIRHVMLSSVQKELLQNRYDLTGFQALAVARDIARIFNYRFNSQAPSVSQLMSATGADVERLPAALGERLMELLQFCIDDEHCSVTFGRNHCLGNILILAVVRQAMANVTIVDDHLVLARGDAGRIYDAISGLGELIGCCPDAVMPATTVPAQLRFRYSDGVEVTGEDKSSKAQRSAAVERVTVDFSGTPHVSERVIGHIRDADILIMAPGSLYSSIIPVMQVPGIAQAVRENRGGLKLLIANLWVQQGETDKSISDPDRKFHVSDMIRAYEQNLPGGIEGLFDQILCLSMQDVPASVIQNYAVEGKNPIYLDHVLIRQRGFEPIECGFFSRAAMLERGVIQHDPDVVARTVKTLYLAQDLFSRKKPSEPSAPVEGCIYQGISRLVSIPSSKYRAIVRRLESISVNLEQCSSTLLTEGEIVESLVDIIWSHQDIPLSHLDYITDIVCINERQWRRDQRWDNVFSFYDPESSSITVREDRLQDRFGLEVSFLIALGQSLLGDYASSKLMIPMLYDSREIGSVYHLSLKNREDRTCYFDDVELRRFLQLARMVEQSPTHFTRAINGTEGFTPPGLLMGLLYAWYLDNRFTSHIEYKMSILKARPTELIPEQKRTRDRRVENVKFLRDTVFGKEAKDIL